MGVDYYHCNGCNRGYRDDSDYACCCDCGTTFCNEECGKLVNFTYDYDEDDEEKGYHLVKGEPITCIICRKEYYTQDALFQFLLQHFNLTEKQVAEMWRQNGK